MQHDSQPSIFGDQQTIGTVFAFATAHSALGLSVRPKTPTPEERAQAKQIANRILQTKHEWPTDIPKHIFVQIYSLVEDKTNMLLTCKHLSRFLPTIPRRYYFSFNIRCINDSAYTIVGHDSYIGVDPKYSHQPATQYHPLLQHLDGTHLRNNTIIGSNNRVRVLADDRVFVEGLSVLGANNTILIDQDTIVKNVSILGSGNTIYFHGPLSVFTGMTLTHNGERIDLW